MIEHQELFRLLGKSARYWARCRLPDPDPVQVEDLAQRYFEDPDRERRDQLIILLSIPVCKIARFWARKLGRHLLLDAISVGLLALVDFVDWCECGDLRTRALVHCAWTVKDFLKKETWNAPPRQTRRKVREGKPAPTLRRRELTEVPVPQEALLWELFSPEDLPLLERKAAGMPVPEIAAHMGWKPWRVNQRLRKIFENFQNEGSDCPLYK